MQAPRSMPSFVPIYALVASLSVLLVGIALVWMGYAVIASATADAQQVYSIRRTLFETQKLLLDQETGLRGFTSTGKAEFLQPYIAARREIDGRLRQLDSGLQREFPRNSSADYNALSSNYRSWLRSVAIPLIHRPSRRDATALQRRGKVLMDRMRQEIAVLFERVDTQTRLRDQKQRVILILSAALASLLISAVTIIAIVLNRARRFLEKERARFFENSGDLLCVATFEGYLLRMNPSWQRILGHSPEELVRQPILDFVHPDDVKSTSDSLDGLAKNQPLFGFRNRFLAKDGTYRWFVWNATPDADRRLIYASARDETDRIHLEAELAALSIHDELTGLPNRRYFTNQLEDAVLKAGRYGLHFSVLFFDLDGFKGVNDVFGHTAGDDVLKGISASVRSTLREADFLARVGGDEFAVLLGPTPSPPDNDVVAQKIIRAVSKYTAAHYATSPVSASVGFSTFPDDTRISANLATFADAAMYTAKRAGGSSFCHYGDPAKTIALD